MVSSFLQSYCIADSWNNNTFAPDKFAFGEYSPCVVDGAILTACYLVSAIALGIRLGQLSGRPSTKLLRFKNTGTRWFRVLLTLLVFGIEVFQLLKFEVYKSFKDLYVTDVPTPFQLVSGGFGCLCWLMLMLVLFLELRRFTFSGSWIPRFFLLFTMLCYVIKLYIVQTLKDILPVQAQGNAIYLYYAQVSLVFLLALGPGSGPISRSQLTSQSRGNNSHLQAPLLEDVGLSIAQDDAVTPNQEQRNCDTTFPEGRANILSRAFFYWIFPLLRLGYKRPLVMTDVWKLNQNDTTDDVAERFSVFWDREKQRESPSLLRATWHTFKCEIVVGGVLNCMSMAANLITPIFIGEFSTYFSDAANPAWKGYMLAVGFFLAQMFFAVGQSQYNMQMGRVGMRLRSALLNKVFQKSLCLTQEVRTLPQFSSGKMNNLMSNDTSTMQFFCGFGHSLWSNPLQVLIALVLLYGQLGWVAFVALGIMALAVPLTKFLSTRMMAAFMSIKLFQDRRLTALNESLNSMSVVKFYGWEQSVIDKVQKEREGELGMRWKASVYQAWFGFVASALPIVVSLVSFGFTVAFSKSTGKTINSGLLFTSLAYFSALGGPLAMIPISMNFWFRFKISCDRVREFLLAPEREALPSPPDTPAQTPVHIKDATFTWYEYSKHENAAVEGWSLQGLNLEVTRNQLIAVVGSTGSGKSSLLSAIAGDMTLKQGQMAVSASVAVVPQEAWIFNATLRANVLFGKPFDQARYDQALRVSCLDTDVAKMDYGDQTELGAKGVNLSGGQKQRVSIARAVYSDAQLYLLDDCLSALDAHVARDVFTKCIATALVQGGKTVIFATNRLEFVGECDKVVLLNNGDITAAGTVNEVKKASEEFRSMLAQVGGGQLDHKEEGEEKAAEASSSSSNTGSDNKQKKAAKQGAGAKLVQEEKREVGGISWEVMKAYMRGIGGYNTTLLFGVLLLISQGVTSGMAFFLADWGEKAKSSSTGVGDYILYYAGIQVAQLCAVLAISFYSKVLSIRASAELHKNMLLSVYRSPMSFFHSNTLGRITNRFSKDIADLDMNAMPNVQKFVQSLLSLFGALLVMCYTTVYTTALVAPIFFLFFFVARYFQKSNLEVKRLDSLSRGPIFSQFSECVEGMQSIRTYRQEAHELAKSADRVDTHIALDLMQQSLNQWLNIALCFFGSALVLGASFFGVAGKNVLGASLALMAIQTSTSISPVLAALLTNWAVAEQGLNAVERVEEYSTLPAEQPASVVPLIRPSPDWPTKGEVTWKGAVARYRSDLAPILRGLNVTINAGEKIGIVGRTGAGKSTLFLTLFRILELDEGSLEVDGIDISKIDLQHARAVLSIIPQEPVLFHGTLRYNLDPYNQYSDEAVWSAIAQARLAPYVKSQSLGLAMEVAENGSNFSSGQKQLVCLARALLKGSKILILDEATASVDVQTDALIQETIREAFSECTVLAIAHRLNTIIDSDKILVLDQGVAKEYGTPKSLLDDPSSQFTAMVEDTGEQNATVLRKVAEGHLDIKAAILAVAAEADVSKQADEEAKAAQQATSSSETETSKKSKLARSLWTKTALLVKKKMLEDRLGNMKSTVAPKTPSERLLALRSAMSEVLDLEHELTGQGDMNFNFLSQLSQIATQLTTRVQQRMSEMHEAQIERSITLGNVHLHA